jgi:transposase
MIANDNIDVWSLDEVHFQQYGSRCQMWVPPEVKEPVLLHHPTRRSVGYFGAVRIRDGKFVYQREDDSFNGDTFWTFLKRLRKASCHAQRKVYVILDNARYHHARLHKQWRELCSPTFTLLFLPAYSPELNPIERVWKLTRKLSIHNRYFPTLCHVVETVESQFNKWSKKSEDLRRLCVV